MEYTVRALGRIDSNSNWISLLYQHWVTELCLAINSMRPIYRVPWNLVNLGSGNGLVPVRCQAELPEPILAYCYLDLLEQTSVKSELKIHKFSFKKLYLKMLSAKWPPFYSGLNVNYYLVLWTPTTAHLSLKERWSTLNAINTVVMLLSEDYYFPLLFCYNPIFCHVQ